MSAAPPAEEGAPDGAAKKGGKKRLILLAVPVVLAAVGAGLWFGGILPPLLGMGKKDAHAEAPKAEAHGAAKPAEHAAAKPAEHGAKPAEHGAKPAEGKGEAAKAGEGGAGGPNFMDLPELIANLNSGPRRTVYVKIKPKLELARAEDEGSVRAAMPRLMDLFQTYLREMRPEELRGSAGTYRLREELLARANIAVAPVRVVDVLFPEILVQ